ncbi:MAG: hypothetical protein EBW45_05180, partial [Actinobacteria bacterium]|nr:hypothetical protein [Actinomycetota bacterium]
VQSGDGNKTFQFEATGDNFGSSENLNLASGKVYKINGDTVLSASQLSTNVAVELESLNIDGGTAATEVTADDLFIIDDGASGSNKKVTAQLISDYVLGGSGGATFSNVNVTGIATVNQFNAADASITGVATASEFRGSDFRDVDGSLVPLVGVSSNLAHTGLVTAFRFYGTGLEEYVVADEVANIKISGVAASTYTTSQTVSATEGQTAFTFSAGYEDGFLDAYLNGIRLIPGVDFSTAPNNTSVTLTSGATAGDELEMVAYKSLGDIYSLNQLSIVNALTVSGVVTAGSFNGALNFTGVSTAGQLQTTDVNASGIVTATGGFVGALTGNADTATALETARNFSASGDASASAVSFDGTGNVDLGLTLATVNSNVGSFGSQTQIPVVTVNAKGLVTAVTTASVGTALTVTGDSGTEQIDLLSEALAITGGANVTTSAAANGVEVALDSDISVTSVNASTVNVSAGATVGGALDVNGGADISGGETVLSSATVSDLTQGRVVLAGASGAIEDSANLTFGANGLTVTGGALVSAASTFSSDLAVGGNVVVSGDLTVNGTTTQINTVQMTVEDTLIELQVIDGSAPSSDTNKDVGLVMNYFDGSAKKAAFYWDDSASRFVLTGDASESSGVVTAASYASLEVGGLFVNDCAGASQVISCSGTT